ncbi:zinc-binding alcohol dehydrogenase family protein [candidate division KSB1 bacterium]|nr:zinc-binding alcohol dehydrogenase family protein [candidate division KSB1 bacterium]RQW06891.1 MAG: zinc-binding alcohol dehydrogenase family protein [candidate division KSB1 bacterium]
MKAFRLTEPGKTDFFDIPEPVMGVEDILIDVHFVGLCGSDLSTYRGKMPGMDYPRIPGHEISGIIIDKGANVPDRLSLGDKVMISPYTNCGMCPACRIGRTNTCEFNQTLGVQRDGALTEKLAIHYSKAHASQKLSLPELALVEPLSVGYHATNRGLVSETDTVLVYGAGAIGMGVLVACLRKGATVIVADIDDRKLHHAKKMGAHLTVNSSKEDLVEVVHERTRNEGVNVAIEAAGIPETFSQAVELVCFAGRVVYIGYTKTKVSFDSTLVVRKELTICGSRNALHVFPAVIKMLEKKEHPFESLITKVYPFGQTGRALADWDANSGAVTKLLIKVKRS